MKKDWLINAATATLVLCAVVVTGLVVRRELFSSTPQTVARPEYVQDWRPYAQAGQAMGPAGAAVTVVEFSDFQCPACRLLAGSLKELRERHPDDVRVVYRHFPLRSHPHAPAAARASECAAAQGRFEAVHDALFAAQDSVGLLPWSRFAREGGVPDLPAFERCVSETGPLAALERDTAAGGRLGVKGTPTLLINGRKHVGAPPAEVLEQMVREELEKARRAASR